MTKANETVEGCRHVSFARDWRGLIEKVACRACIQAALDRERAQLVEALRDVRPVVEFFAAAKRPDAIELLARIDAALKGDA